MLTPDERAVAEVQLHARLGRIADQALHGVAAALADGRTAEAVATVEEIVTAAVEASYAAEASWLDLMADTTSRLNPPAMRVVVPDLADPAEIVAKVQQQVSAEVYRGMQAAAEDWAFVHGADVEWWLRRVSPGEVCGLCIQAATRVYRTPSLRPIHDHCRCTIRPVLADDSMADLIGPTRDLQQQVAADLTDAADRLGLPRRAGQRQRSRASNVRLGA